MKDSLFLVIGIMDTGDVLSESRGFRGKEGPRVLTTRNSIIYHPPDASIGWDADWGVAASSRI
jgi:hypothetical protein